MGAVNLIVVHYHWRPGGVRRVIENGLPALARRAARVGRVPAPCRIIMAAGERAPVQWAAELERRVRPARIEWRTVPAFGYAGGRVSAGWRNSGLQNVVARLLEVAAAPAGDYESFPLEPRRVAVWAHNLSLGRNLPLAEALVAETRARRIPLLIHHHDYWFDQRLHRIDEVHEAAAGDLTRVAEACFPATGTAVPILLNRWAAALARRHRAGVAWIPNPAFGDCPPRRTHPARRAKSDRPLWLMPTRALRRKNLAEAVLIARWIQPDARIVTTGAASPDDSTYIRRLIFAARAESWDLSVGVLDGRSEESGALARLFASASAVVVTSLQEGFGLPLIEAARAGVPVIWRRLRNISGDLARMGFSFPQVYDEVRVDLKLFDWAGELRRQRQLFAEWRDQLPDAWRRIDNPPWWQSRVTVPFSRLTLSAQLAVLTVPPGRSWRRCLAHNPRLERWRLRAQRGGLRATAWPERARAWLGAGAFAARIMRAIRSTDTAIPPAAGSPCAVQDALARHHFKSWNLYPLLWSADT